MARLRASISSVKSEIVKLKDERDTLRGSLEHEKACTETLTKALEGTYAASKACQQLVKHEASSKRKTLTKALEGTHAACQQLVKRVSS